MAAAVPDWAVRAAELARAMPALAAAVPDWAVSLAALARVIALVPDQAI